MYSVFFKVSKCSVKDRAPVYILLGRVLTSSFSDKEHHQVHAWIRKVCLCVCVWGGGGGVWLGPGPKDQQTSKGYDTKVERAIQSYLHIIARSNLTYNCKFHSNTKLIYYN